MANTYTSLLQLRMPALGDVGWDDELNDNFMLFEFAMASLLRSNVVISGLAPTDGGGLDVDYTAGAVVVGGAEYSVGSGSKTCSSGVKNWLYVDSSGTVQISSTQPTGDYVALALVDAGSSTIDRIGDPRNFAEGALTIGIDYSPDYYDPDTGETGAINQHLAGVDARLAIMGKLKNRLINGNFDLWQRATSQTSKGYGSDDRWGNYHSGSTKTHSQQAFIAGQTDVPGNPKYFSRTVVTTGSGTGDYVVKTHALEGVNTLAGEAAILSLWAKADASKNIAVEFRQSFGTGGTPSSGINGIGVTTLNLTTSWQKFQIPVNIPSISGKTIGTNNDDTLQIYIFFDAGSDYDARTNSLGNQSGTFDLARVQFEAGSIASDFENRPAALEWLFCQRYFQKFTNLLDRGHNPNTTSGFSTLQVTQLNMRATPTATLSNVQTVKVQAATALIESATANAVVARAQLESGTSGDYKFQFDLTLESELG